MINPPNTPHIKGTPRSPTPWKVDFGEQAFSYQILAFQSLFGNSILFLCAPYAQGHNTAFSIWCIMAARHLLENDLKTVQEISRKVGYEDLNFFSKLFKRYTGLSPTMYRERFSVNTLNGVTCRKRTHHH